MNRQYNFSPASGVGIAVAAAGLTSFGAGAQYQPDAMIDNRGDVDAFIRFGDASVLSDVATGMRIPAGAIFILGKSTATHIAVAVASGTPALVIHLGAGV